MHCFQNRSSQNNTDDIGEIYMAFLEGVGKAIGKVSQGISDAGWYGKLDKSNQG
jgi:hypothetical protein